MMTEEIFANNFWGLEDDGFHVLTAKMNNNKKTFEDIKAFYNFRATLHEEFGRKLMKHVKNSMGREEIGTLDGLLKSAREETERTAQSHIDLSLKLKMKVEVELNNFVLDQKDKRKLTHFNAEKAHRFKKSSESYLLKVKEKYESEFAKLTTLQTQIGKVSGREAEKLRQKIDRTQHEIRVQEQEYKNACQKAADATLSWNKTWKSACDTYQVMEKQRLEFIHHSFSMYINILSTASSQDTESFERFWKALDSYDAAKDIQTFIQTKSTGAKIPEAEIFVDYHDDPEKTFQQHSIANFPVPQELVSPTTEQLLELSTTSDSIEAIPPSEVPSTNSPTEINSKNIPRRPSIHTVKPLPSVSLSQNAKRNPASIEDQPVLVVPDTSLTTDASDETFDTKDVVIDPRAKVMLAIGNNMFDCHLDQQQELTRQNSMLKANVRRIESRRRRPSAELEATVNFSYQSLFEELGVYDNKSTDLRRKVTRRQTQTKVSSTECSTQKVPDMETYVQQQYDQPQKAHSYAHPTPSTAHVYHSTQNAPTILYWVVALADWYSGKPEELQFSRGTLLGVTEVRSNGWYFAIKFDSRLNTLTNEQGYVAQTMVQLCT